MSAREAFGVVVRTVGLLCLLYGGWCGLVWLRYAAGMTHLLPSEVRSQTLYLLAAGAGLLRGAGLVVSFAYPAPVEPGASVVEPAEAGRSRAAVG